MTTHEVRARRLRGALLGGPPSALAGSHPSTRRIQRKIHELLAPLVFIDEVAGALTKAERQQAIAVGQAAPLFAKVMNSPPGLIPHGPLIARAIEISSRTRSAYYDCLYVALAEREACELVTADQKSIINSC
jgi:predicted nucleic acid-binding protein